MKKKLLLALPLILLSACQPKGPTQEQYDALAAKYDSISSHSNELQDLIGAVSTSLDSISTQEGLLFVNNNDGSKVTKQQMLSRIKSYKDLLSRQQAQLQELEKQQNSNLASIRELKTIISRLREEIQSKEARIAELENEVTTKNQNIETLQQNLTQSEATNKAITEERDALQEVNEAQDKLINTGYYLVATKSVLKNMGLLKGVFKKKADYANINKSDFKEIDIRQFEELTINCKSPKIITEKPIGSYSLIDNGNGTTTLKISDPSAFWAASPYLIIMSK